MRSLLEPSLIRLPRLYAWLIGRRRHPNLEKAVFLLLVQRGDCVVEVGANTGYYTRLFAQLVGARGCVHAFEPIPPTFAGLQASLRGAPAGRVVLNNCALAEEEGTAPLYLPGADHGQAALARHSFGSWAATDVPVQTYSCRTATLDAYVAAAGLAALNFVKCDVEGAELLVLRGAQETIRRFKPLLFLEVSRHWTEGFGYAPADLARFLEVLGYSRFFLVEDEIRPVTDLPRELADGRLPDSVNLLCADPALHARRLARLEPWLARSPERR